MTENAFDAFTRRAAEGISRRGSLVTLGGAALAATFAGASVAKAGKAGKKARKKCKKQGAPCQEFAEELCDLFFNPGTELDECIEAASECCAPLTRCQAGPFFDCAFQVILALV